MTAVIMKIWWKTDNTRYWIYYRNILSIIWL